MAEDAAVLRHDKRVAEHSEIRLQPDGFAIGSDRLNRDAGILAAGESPVARQLDLERSWRGRAGSAPSVVRIGCLEGFRHRRLLDLEIAEHRVAEAAFVRHIGEEPVSARRQRRQRGGERAGRKPDRMQVSHRVEAVRSDDEDVHEFAVVGNERSDIAEEAGRAFREIHGQSENLLIVGRLQARAHLERLEEHPGEVLVLLRFPPLLSTPQGQSDDQCGYQRRAESSSPMQGRRRFARTQHALLRRRPGHADEQRHQ